jgi:predicted nucleic acid-binding protein
LILVDTTPLVALCDEHDQHHDRARAELNRLPRGPLVISTCVLTEACFHLQSASLRRRLGDLITDLSIVPVEDEAELGLWFEIFGWLERYAEHRPDLADGVLAVLSGRERRSTVWTFDSEFDVLWRRPDGTRIPLAVTGR